MSGSENKYKEAIKYYDPIVKRHSDNILNVTAIVLADLCVSYIMTSQNEEAEELMRKIEKEEEQLAYEDPDKKVFHLCIVNLVIGEHNNQLNKTCLIRFPVLLVKALRGILN